MVNEIHIAFLSCSIDTFSIQAFIVDKREGKWEIPRKGLVIRLGDSIGRGGMRECYEAQISHLPEQYDGLAPNGWVAKVDIGNVPGNTYDLCWKVSV